MNAKACERLEESGPRGESVDLAGTANSQHGPEYGYGVIPEPTAPGPALHHFSGDWFGFGDVAFLTLTHFLSQRPIVEEDVVLVIEFEASAVHVGGTDQRYLSVKG
jgi:hypothetical protein